MKKFTEKHREQVAHLAPEIVNHVNNFFLERGIPFELSGLTIVPASNRPCPKTCPEGQHCHWTIGNNGSLFMECVDD